MSMIALVIGLSFSWGSFSNASANYDDTPYTVAISDVNSNFDTAGSLGNWNSVADENDDYVINSAYTVTQGSAYESAKFGALNEGV